MRNLIGIDRKIKRAWLDAALDRLAESPRPDELRALVDDCLRAELPGLASRARALRIVLRIWSSIPARLVPLRTDALNILPSITSQERTWLHWGMAILAYPFFRDVVEILGRLFALQEELSAAHVQARSPAQWGAGTRAKEAVPALLHTLVDWEVLQPGKLGGHFRTAGTLATDSTVLQVWLLEALLRASRSDEMEARELKRLPEAFPFRFDVKRSHLRRHERFSLHRRAPGTVVVSLCFHKQERGFNPPRPLRNPTAEGAAVSNSGGLAQEMQPEPAASDLRAANEGKTSDGETEAPDFPFASPWAECRDLLREGHFHGCIALAQALIEGVIRRAWQERMKLGRTKAGSFSDNVRSLCSMGVISIELKTRLDRLWIERGEFLNRDAATAPDSARLAVIAAHTVETLVELERLFFGG